MGDEQKQLCMIKIMFPAETDEQAIAYKKKIAEVLAGVTGANIQFTLTSMPSGVDLRPANSRTA